MTHNHTIDALIADEALCENVKEMLSLASAQLADLEYDLHQPVAGLSLWLDSLQRVIDGLETVHDRGLVQLAKQEA